MTISEFKKQFDNLGPVLKKFVMGMTTEDGSLDGVDLSKLQLYTCLINGCIDEGGIKSFFGEDFNIVRVFSMIKYFVETCDIPYEELKCAFLNTKFVSSTPDVIQRSWVDVEYSLKICEWFREIHNGDKTRIHPVDRVFYDSLTNDESAEGGWMRVNVGINGTRGRIRKHFITEVKNLVLEVVNNEGVFASFCRTMSKRIGCSFDEVTYAMCRIDWCDNVLGRDDSAKLYVAQVPPPINEPEMVKNFDIVDYENHMISRRKTVDKRIQKLNAQEADNVPKNVMCTLEEWWSVAKTQMMCRNLSRSSHAWIPFQVMRDSKLSPCGKFYITNVHYRHSKSRSSGRWYADVASFQSCNGAMRRYMSYDECCENSEWDLRDIDIDNCFPVILNQIAERHGIELKYMHEYVENRDAILKETQRLYSCSRDDAKRIFLIEMHGGESYKFLLNDLKITKEKLKDIDFEFLKNFKSDIRLAYDSLKHTEEFKNIFNEIAADDTKINKRGTFISYVCQDVESDIISTCIQICTDWGYKISTLVFDGFMIRWCRDQSKRKHNDECHFLRDLEREVEVRTKYRLGFSNKSLETKAHDLDTIRSDGEGEIDYFGNITKIYNEGDMMTSNTSTGVRPVLHPITDDKRVTIITAGMFNGKSTTCAKYLRNALEDPSATALFPSCRIQQALTLMGQLDGLSFKYYKDPKTVKNEPRLVSQYESLHLLEEGLVRGDIRYDVVVLDESHSILKTMVSTATNRKNLKANARVLRLVLQMAKKVIFLDADNQYDACVSEYLSSIFQEDEMEHLWYKHNAMKRTVVYTDEPYWNKTLNDNMRDNHNVMVCFKSKRKLEEWYNTTINGEYYTDDNDEKQCMKIGIKFGVRRFTSKTSEQDMKIFENINELPDTGLYMAFTSKVLVGADILKPFHRIFLNGIGALGPTARELLQMVGRGRICDTTEIYTVMPTPNKVSMKVKKLDTKTLHTSKFRDYKRQQDDRESYVDHLLNEYDLNFNGVGIEWTPSPVLKMYAHRVVEESLELAVEFHRLIKQKGYGIEFKFHEMSQREEEEFKYDREESLAEISENTRIEFKQAVEAVKEKTIFEIIAHCEAFRHDKNSKTCSQQMVADIAFACKLFPEHYKDFEADVIKSIIKNRSMLHLARNVYLRNEEDATVYLRDLISMKYASIPEFAQLTGAYIERLDRLLQNLGFSKGVLDRGNPIESQDLSNKLGIYSSELLKLGKDRGTIRCTSKNNITRLKAELRLIGLTLERSRKRHSKNSWTTYYALDMDENVSKLLPLMKRNYSVEVSGEGERITENPDVTRESFVDRSLADKGADFAMFAQQMGLVEEKKLRKLEVENVLGKLSKVESNKLSIGLEAAKAAGVIPWTISETGVPLILVQRMENGEIQDFGGKRDRGETCSETAYREMMEESNNKIDFITLSDITEAKTVYNSWSKYNISVVYVKRTPSIMDIDYGSFEGHTGYKRRVVWIPLDSSLKSNMNHRIKQVFYEITTHIEKNS